jgi:hypothetical protein
MKVKYEGKIYKVKYNTFCNDQRFFFLKSNWLDGSPFPALKKDCEVVE